jgi:hypothetical protein
MRSGKLQKPVLRARQLKVAAYRDEKSRFDLRGTTQSHAAQTTAPCCQRMCCRTAVAATPHQAHDRLFLLPDYSNRFNAEREVSGDDTRQIDPASQVPDSEDSSVKFHRRYALVIVSLGTTTKRREATRSRRTNEVEPWIAETS